MADRTCSKCGQVFSFPSKLKRHLERKKPCVAAVAPSTQAEYACRYCGQSFGQRQNRHRHEHNHCPRRKKQLAESEHEPRVLAADELELRLEAHIREHEARMQAQLEAIKAVLASAPAGVALPAPSGVRAVETMSNSGIIQSAETVSNVGQQLQLRPATSSSQLWRRGHLGLRSGHQRDAGRDARGHRRGRSVERDLP